jgi:hypothetical protein
VAANPAVPDWLKKWAALTLQFVHKEKEVLPAVSNMHHTRTSGSLRLEGRCESNRHIYIYIYIYICNTSCQAGAGVCDPAAKRSSFAPHQ